MSLNGGNDSGTTGITIYVGGDRTPLFKAIFDGDYAEARRLLDDPHTNVNASTEEGVGPLHMAALKDQGDLVKRLVQRGAHIDAYDSRGNTPLHVASRLGCKSSAAALVELGADVKKRDARGNTALHLSLSPNVAQFVADYVKRDIAPLALSGSLLSALFSQGP